MIGKGHGPAIKTCEHPRPFCFWVVIRLYLLPTSAFGGFGLLYGKSHPSVVWDGERAFP